MITDVRRCEAYIDDVIVYSDTWNSHLSKFVSSSITLRLLSKGAFGHALVQFLGHAIGGGEVKPITAKVNAINHFPILNYKKELMRF